MSPSLQQVLADVTDSALSRTSAVDSVRAADEAWARGRSLRTQRRVGVVLAACAAVGVAVGAVRSVADATVPGGIVPGAGPAVASGSDVASTSIELRHVLTFAVPLLAVVAVVVVLPRLRNPRLGPFVEPLPWSAAFLGGMALLFNPLLVQSWLTIPHGDDRWFWSGPTLVGLVGAGLTAAAVRAAGAPAALRRGLVGLGLGVILFFCRHVMGGVTGGNYGSTFLIDITRTWLVVLATTAGGVAAAVLVTPAVGSARRRYHLAVLVTTALALTAVDANHLADGIRNPRSLDWWYVPYLVTFAIVLVPVALACADRICDMRAGRPARPDAAGLRVLPVPSVLLAASAAVVAAVVLRNPWSLPSQPALAAAAVLYLALSWAAARSAGFLHPVTRAVLGLAATVATLSVLDGWLWYLDKVGPVTSGHDVTFSGFATSAIPYSLEVIVVAVAGLAPIAVRRGTQSWTAPAVASVAMLVATVIETVQDPLLSQQQWGKPEAIVIGVLAPVALGVTLRLWHRFEPAGGLLDL